MLSSLEFSGRASKQDKRNISTYFKVPEQELINGLNIVTLDCRAGHENQHLQDGDEFISMIEAAFPNSKKVYSIHTFDSKSQRDYRSTQYAEDPSLNSHTEQEKLGTTVLLMKHIPPKRMRFLKIINAIFKDRTKETNTNNSDSRQIYGTRAQGNQSSSTVASDSSLVNTFQGKPSVVSAYSPL